MKRAKKMTNQDNDEEIRKKAIFESMSPRRKAFIQKKGYEKWDPFMEPKDPIDIRKDQSNRTSQMLVREFLQSRSLEGYSNAYGRGVLEMVIGFINNDDRFLGMYEFVVWHKDLLKAENRK